MKKLLSIVLAVAMIMAISVPAFAAATDKTVAMATDGTMSGNVTVTGVTKIPVIKVTVPSAAGVAFNPYQLETTITTSGGDVTVEGTKVISPIQGIKSESEIDIAVEVSAYSTKSGEVVLVESGNEIDTTSGEKQVVLWLEKDTNPTYNAATEDAAASYEANAINSTWSATDDIAIAISKPTSSSPAVVHELGTLAAGDKIVDGDGVVTGYEMSHIAFAVRGDLNNTGVVWAAKDSATVTLAFTFTPQVATADAGN